MSTSRSGSRSSERRRKKSVVLSEALTHEVVVSAALELLDREGVDRFTMRRLATHLGVTTMATYYLFESKDELLAAVYQQAFAERPVPATGGPWLAEAIALALWIRDGYLAHPAVVSLRARVAWPTPASVHMAERWLNALKRGGFEGKALARAYHSITAAVLGLVEQEATSATRPISKNLQAAIGQAPLLRAVLPDLQTIDRRRAFEHAVRILLEGLGQIDSNSAALREERDGA